MQNLKNKFVTCGRKCLTSNQKQKISMKKIDFKTTYERVEMQLIEVEIENAVLASSPAVTTPQVTNMSSGGIWTN